MCPHMPPGTTWSARSRRTLSRELDIAPSVLASGYFAQSARSAGSRHLPKVRARLQIDYEFTPTKEGRLRFSQTRGRNGGENPRRPTPNRARACANVAAIFMVLASKNYSAARRTDIIVRLLTWSF